MKLYKYLAFFAFLSFAVTSCTENEDLVETETIVDSTGLNVTVDNRSVITGEALAWYCDGFFDEEGTKAELVLVTNSSTFIDQFDLSIEENQEFEFDEEILEEGDFIFISLIFSFEDPSFPSQKIEFVSTKLDLGEGLQIYENNKGEDFSTFTELGADHIAGSFTGDLYDENDEVVGQVAGEFDTENINLDQCD